MPHLPAIHHPHRRPTSHIPKRQIPRPMPHLQMGNQHPQASYHRPPLRALQPNLWPLRAHAQTPSNRQIQRPVHELQEATTDRPACTSRPRPRPQTLPSSPPRPSHQVPNRRAQERPPLTPRTARPPRTSRATPTPPHHGINHTQEHRAHWYMQTGQHPGQLTNTHRRPPQEQKRATGKHK